MYYHLYRCLEGTWKILYPLLLKQLESVVILILSRFMKICVSPRFLVSCSKLMNTSAGNISFPAFVYLYKTLKPPCSKLNKKATMMNFIGSFEYHVTFLVKIRRFSGHRNWTFCIVGQWFLDKFSGRSSL